jgi:hypothetical protein
VWPFCAECRAALLDKQPGRYSTRWRLYRIHENSTEGYAESARTMDTGSPNDEERRLLAEYETVARFYSWALGQLARQVETMPYDECKRLLKMAEDALVGREEARLALESCKKANSN